MHFLDFLSTSPKLFIFEKETAKTNFGGILFCFYIIIMLSISLSYIINYAVNDKYTFEIKKIDNTTNNEIPIQINKTNIRKIKPYEELDKDEELNPLLNISIVIMSHYGYRLYDKNIRKYLEGDCLDFYHNIYLYNITRRVSKVLNLNEWGLDNGLEYRYMCGNDSNCSKIDRELKDIDIEFFFWFTGYKLDHQAEIPFQIDRDKRYMFPRVFGIDLFYQGAIVEFDWEVIQYKDKQSIFVIS